MRKFLSAVLVLVMLVTLAVPSVMAAEAQPTEEQAATGVVAEAPAEKNESNLVANIAVFAVLALVVGTSVALIIDKKKKLYK